MMRDYNVAWLLGGTINECWIAAIKPIGSDDTHLGPVGKKYMVFKHSYPKRMWRLCSTIEYNFPENQTTFQTINEVEHNTGRLLYL